MIEELVKIETLKMLQEKGFNEYHWATQSVAQKWLREIKNFHICIVKDVSGYGYDICKTDDDSFVDDSGLYSNDNLWTTYEEALEAGIQRALELI